jgi:hypothetical protein
MRTIELPEWNDLPEHIRAGLVAEGNYWDAFIGADMAHGLYIKLRHLLEGTNLDDAPDLFPDQPPDP